MRESVRESVRERESMRERVSERVSVRESVCLSTLRLFMNIRRFLDESRCTPVIHSELVLS